MRRLLLLLPALFAVTAPAAALQAVDPPRGVNVSIVGSAEQFRSEGPARICLIHTSIDVESGETAYLDYLGFHHGAVRIVGPSGTFRVAEGDNWAEPTESVARVEDSSGRTINRYGPVDRPRYLIYGRADYSPNQDQPLVWVDGDALTGTDDATILRRVDAEQDELASCTRRIVYGLE